MSSFVKAIGLALVVIAIGPTSASFAVARTWVSGQGDDANPCSRTAACKTFAGAISKTDAGGEIDVLDPGGFGTVTITKSITIDGTGQLSSILDTGVNGVIVNAATTDDVVLRGFTIQGGVAGACPSTAIDGVKVMSARSVSIEHVSIADQQVAVDLIPAVASVDVFLDGVTINNNCTAGIHAAPTGTGKLKGFIRNSTITGSGIGVDASGSANFWLSGNTIFGNTVGVQAASGAVLNDQGSNQIVGNGTDGSLTSPTATPTPAPAAPTVYCVVPKLTGLTKSAARAKLTRAHCKLGKASLLTTHKKKSVGRVLTQNVVARTRAVENTVVGVSLGRKAK